MKINERKLWSRAQWTCKSRRATEQLRIWSVIGGRSDDPHHRNLVVRRRKPSPKHPSGQVVGPEDKWIDAVKMRAFVDSSR